MGDKRINETIYAYVSENIHTMIFIFYLNLNTLETYKQQQRQNLVSNFIPILFQYKLIH